MKVGSRSYILRLRQSWRRVARSLCLMRSRRFIYTQRVGGPVGIMEGSSSKAPTALQRHVAFFDRNGDGVVYPSETYQGFRALGFGAFTSLFASLFINLGLSYSTLESWLPNPSFPIHIKNIHKAKHGSDTDIYDHEGRFSEARFDELFGRFASHPRKIARGELMTMVRHNREAWDVGGWVAAWAEWTFLYNLAKDKDGHVDKDAIRAAYDGSLFHTIEESRKQRR